MFHRRAIGCWIGGGSTLVAGMILLGGWTRLTESGLSMVDWSLLHFRPPKSQADWQAYFDKYKGFPEFKLKNSEMTLGEFKRIYYYEHLHRVLGRVTGLYFLVPAIWITVKRLAPSFVLRRIWLLNGLIGAQGLLGWHMVKSGLDDKIVETNSVPRVSHLRLTSHLGVAFVIYGVSLQTALKLLLPAAEAGKYPLLKSLSVGIGALTFLTALSGGMVAGLDAGLLYDTFPRMGTQFLPSEAFSMEPKWRNMLYNPTTVQFTHRYLGKTAFASVVAFYLYSRRIALPNRLRKSVGCMLLAASVQLVLGISTILSGVKLELASLHQAGSIALFSSSIFLCSQL